jgi:hypothetical protein
LGGALCLWLPLLCLGCPDEPPSSHGTETDEGSEGPIHDPLSMPEHPTLSPTSFRSAEECAPCHPNQYDDWRLSRHAWAMQDPLFRRLVEQRQDDLDASEDQFCTQCHSAICTRGGECVSGFEFDSLSEISLEGITCESCHKVSAIERPYNSGHVLEEEGPVFGPLADPSPSSFHESEQRDFFDDSEFCGACHDVVENSGLNLERPYAEWLESPAAEAGKNCQSCHMPTYEGKAAMGGPDRAGLHRHRFVGVEFPLIPEILEDADLQAEIDAQIEALLDQAAGLRVEAPAGAATGQQMDLRVTIENRIDAHAFPTGSTFLRQAWVELTVRDANDDLLYQTGHLDDKGDLQDHWSTLTPYEDPDLIVLNSGLIDAFGQPTLFSWLAAEHSTRSISPLHERTYTLFVPVPDDAQGPLEVDARLHFRAYPPFLLELLEMPGEFDEIMQVRDLASDTLSVDLQDAPP